MTTPSTPDRPPRSLPDADPAAEASESPSAGRSPEAAKRSTKSPETPHGKTAEPKGNPVGWSGLLLAAVALASQAFLLNFVIRPGTGGAELTYQPPGLLWDSSNGIASFLVLFVLIASIAAVVVAVVALFGKRKPLWISWVTIGVGLAVFIGTVSFWQAAATAS